MTMLNRSKTTLRTLASLTALIALPVIGASFTAPAYADRSNLEVVETEVSEQRSVFGAYMGAAHAELQNDFATAAALLDRVLENQPDDPLLQRRAMLAHLNAGNVDRAIDLARPQINVYPNDVDITAVALAADALANAQWDEVEKLLSSPRQIALARYAAPILTAWARQGAGKTDAAIEALSILRQNQQSDIVPDLYAGLIFMASGRPEEAEAVLAPHAKTLERTLTDVPRLLARAQQAMGQTEAAIALLQSFIDLQPGLVQVDRDIADLKDGKTLPPLASNAAEGAAMALVELARQVRNQAPRIALRYANVGAYLDADSKFGHMVIGHILQDVERPAEAITAFRKISEESPYYWGARMEIADSLIDLDRDEEVIEQLEAMTQERSDDISALNKLGLLMRIRQTFEDGVDYYDRAIERLEAVENDHWYLFYYRGITLERTKRWDEAEADFKRALELSPNQAYVLNYLGYSWVDQGINIEEAMDMIRNAVEQLPQDGNIVDSLGWAYYRLGEYEEAVFQLERAVQLNSSEPVINDHLGDAYWKVGRFFEARYQWSHVLDMGPDDTLRAAVEEKLEKGLDAVEAAAAE